MHRKVEFKIILQTPLHVGAGECENPLIVEGHNSAEVLQDVPEYYYESGTEDSHYRTAVIENLPVICTVKNPVTSAPYIPGSTLRGILRVQLEQRFNLPLVKVPTPHKWSPMRRHICTAPEKAANCPICSTFGAKIPKTDGEVEIIYPNHLLIRDALPVNWNDFKYDYRVVRRTDRITGATTAIKVLEVVPAGVVFEGEIILRKFPYNHEERFQIIVDELKKLKLIGGHTSQGLGIINIEIM